MEIKFSIIAIISFVIILCIIEYILFKRKVRKITEKIQQEWNTIHNTDTENSTIQEIGEEYRNSNSDDEDGIDDIMKTLFITKNFIPNINIIYYL